VDRQLRNEKRRLIIDGERDAFPHLLNLIRSGEVRMTFLEFTYWFDGQDKVFTGHDVRHGDVTVFINNGVSHVRDYLERTMHGAWGLYYIPLITSPHKHNVCVLRGLELRVYLVSHGIDLSTEPSMPFLLKEICKARGPGGLLRAR